MSFYLKGRFYAKLIVKYLMKNVYATAIGAKCIVMYSLRQLLKLIIIKVFLVIT